MTHHQYNQPQDVLADSSITRDEQIVILKSWAYDARDMEVAEEENMGGERKSGLRDVLIALNELGVSEEFLQGNTKQGG